MPASHGMIRLLSLEAPSYLNIVMPQTHSLWATGSHGTIQLEHELGLTLLSCLATTQDLMAMMWWLMAIFLAASFAFCIFRKSTGRKVKFKWSEETGASMHLHLTKIKKR